MEKQQAIKKVVNQCKKTPVFFIEKVLGETLWEKQEEIVKAVQNNNSVAVASCHGIGKSFISARIALHSLSLFPNTQVITTAPTDRQVRKVLWKEIRAAHRKSKIPLGGRVLTKQIQISEEWFALGFSTSNADSFQGMHAENILVVVDEAAGVDQEIFNGIDGVLSNANAKVLYIGNPTNTDGEFYDAYQSDNFVTFNISAFDTPNFTEYDIKLEDIKDGSWEEKAPDDPNDMPFPMLVSPHWVADKAEKWGIDSALFQAKVLGQFPEKEDYTTIPIYLWKSSCTKPSDTLDNINDIQDCQVGIDVARFGTDQSVITIQADDTLIRKFSKGSMDTTEVSEWASRKIRETFQRKVSNFKDVVINVDAIGVGAGVADNLRNNLGYSNVIDVKVSEKAHDEDKFRNKRAEMYWDLRDKLKDGSASIAIHNEELEDQITSIRYEIDSKGRIKLESKKKIRKRLGISPDDADSVALCFYETDSAKGKDFSSAWLRG